MSLYDPARANDWGYGGGYGAGGGGGGGGRGRSGGRGGGRDGGGRGHGGRGGRGGRGGGNFGGGDNMGFGGNFSQDFVSFISCYTLQNCSKFQEIIKYLVKVAQETSSYFVGFGHCFHF